MSVHLKRSPIRRPGEGTVSYAEELTGSDPMRPAGGTARYSGGLRVRMFLNTVTYQQVVTSRQARAEPGELYDQAACAEPFEGHPRSGDGRALQYASARLPRSKHAFASP